MREKRALVKTAPQNYRKNPTNTNALKLKTAQYQLAGIYIKEQTEYIQNQIDKIRDSVEDRQSRIAWQTINEVSRRKNTAKAKLKAANQQERIKLWKQHFENLLGNPPKITHEPITRIISKQLDIKLGPSTQEELDSVLRKIKNRKAAGLDEIPPEVWKTRQFDDILLRHCNADDIAILANTPDQAETLLHSLERAAASIGLYVNAHKTEYMCYNQTGNISIL